MSHDLEAPGDDASPDWDGLYLYRGDEVVDHRLIFTGDVFEGVVPAGSQPSRTVIVLQHPCALRQGRQLVPRLLVAEVEPQKQALRPSDWVRGNYKVMPLPGLTGGQLVENAVARFLQIAVVDEGALRAGRRIACLSPLGVNLLFQRWVNHNTRAVIPVAEYQKVLVGPYEEADLVEEWLDERHVTVGSEDAYLEADTWLSQPQRGTLSRREALEDDHLRGTVRRAARAHIRSLS